MSGNPSSSTALKLQRMEMKGLEDALPPPVDGHLWASSPLMRWYVGHLVGPLEPKSQHKFPDKFGKMCEDEWSGADQAALTKSCSHMKSYPRHQSLNIVWWTPASCWRSDRWNCATSLPRKNGRARCVSTPHQPPGLEILHLPPSPPWTGKFGTPCSQSKGGKPTWNQIYMPQRRTPELSAAPCWNQKALSFVKLKELNHNTLGAQVVWQWPQWYVPASLLEHMDRPRLCFPKG